ncbi:hypothetical protein TNCV_310211 [Trichonephila clavipes]|nr:hypothetical protein TNCV_310211 [Trichonephila clavipes]
MQVPMKMGQISLNDDMVSVDGVNQWLADVDIFPKPARKYQRMLRTISERNASDEITRRWNSNDQTSLMRAWERKGLETHPTGRPERYSP